VPVTYYVAWWNLENLFDIESAPRSRRTGKVMRALGDDLKGWTRPLRDRKIDQLASVIAQMNEGRGPDLLGVCEVENRYVIDLLVENLRKRLNRRDYGIEHADTEDTRGIDVAFLYDTDCFAVPANETFFHVIMRRNATRELVQVNFKTRHRDRTWSVFGNHWPSRSGGQYESSGYRHIAGETLAYFHERVLEVHGTATPVLAMGDFNDEPFDVSMVTHALSTRQRHRVVNAEIPLLWNLMWPLAGGSGGQPDGSFYWESQPNMLDQFLVNANMATEGSPLRVDETSVEILRFAEMTDTGDYPRPVPFGGMGNPVNRDGFSDHFPICVRVTEAD
jgi:hypothetical protein